MSTYRDELFKATEANIVDVKNQINDLMSKLSYLERLKISYTFASTDDDVRLVDNQITNEKKLVEKTARRINKKKKETPTEEKPKGFHIRYRDNEYVLSKLRKSFRKLANREKRNGTGENVLDMKAHITYDSLHREKVQSYTFDDFNTNPPYYPKDGTIGDYEAEPDSHVVKDATQEDLDV